MEPNKLIRIELPAQVWQAILDMAMDRPVPRYISMPCLAKFAEALETAAKPAETEAT